MITGGSSGIGRATALLFAKAGWRVGLIARGGKGLLAAAAEAGATGVATATAQADVSDCAALETAASMIEQALGPIDVWVNCAGNGTYGRFPDTPEAEFRRVTEVTYLGTVNGVRVALRRMTPRDRGRIVNVCSAVAFHGMPLLSSYSGAKHAVRGFGQSVSAELSQEGSRVTLTSVFPPAVNTPFFAHAPSYMGRPSRPIPPVYQPEIVARAIYLAALSGPLEMPVSFTTVFFALGMRIVPGLVRRAILRLGYAGQMADETIAPVPYAPTLDAPADSASTARGVFGAGARSFSVHVGLLRASVALRRAGRAPDSGAASKPD